MKSDKGFFGKYNIADLLFIIAVAVFGFYVNRNIVIKGLYMDDLYMWSCYGEQNLLEFAFPIGTSTRFRPVYWLATYLQMMIVGTHIGRFVAFNIVINIIVALELYYMAKKLSGFSIVSLAVSLCYLASRFAYYQIGQALGLMETMALAFAIAVLWFLCRFMTEEPGENAGRRPFYAALVFYFLLAFTHERYISLFPLFYLALILKPVIAEKGRRAEVLRKEGLCWIWPAVMLAVIVAIRIFAIGKALPAGTGGTEVTDTFSLSQAISYAVSQVFYIFGINAGPEYLNGLPWDQTPEEIKRLVKFSILFIGLLVITYLVSVAHRIFRKKPFLKEMAVLMLFGGFIAVCIVCSSVTIRVEMRWIYVSYAAALLLAAYMTGSVRENLRIMTHFAVLPFLVYSLLSVGTNIYYRGYFGKLYFWPDQLRMNSLAEQTVEKYGIDGVLGKNIYILENSYKMTDFYGSTFFKTFDPEKTAEGTNVIFAADISEVPADEVKSGRALVLKELPEENAYLDITEEFAD